MLKIYAPCVSKQQLGGGWTWRRNIELAMIAKAQFVATWQEADTVLISGVTMVDKTEIHEAHRAGKKIVLRVDNMPRRSRNQRMSPHERMREYADMASTVVYQSKWAQEWIGSYLGKEGVVIHNSVDENVFKPPRIKTERDYPVYMVAQYNRDENKRITEAFDIFTKKWMENPKAKLMIVGNFSPELIANGFDFFRGENIEAYGVQTDPVNMAQLYRQADALIFPVYSDACPNTAIEAWMCGLDVIHTGWQVLTELWELWDSRGRDYFSLPRMANQYLEIL